MKPFETVAITGPRRSGTHLMYRLLDGHPQLFNALEEVYLLDYLHSLPPIVQSEFVNYFVNTDIDDLFYNIDERGWFPLGQQEPGFYDIDWDEFKERINLRRIEKTSLASLWEMWFKTMQDIVGSTDFYQPVVVKNPDYAKSLENHFLFPNIDNWTLKTIVMVRHPFFAFSSLRKLREKEKVEDYRRGRTEKHKVFSVARLLAEIGKYIQMQERISRCVRSALIVRFEDLVVSPKKVMVEVCDFLGIDWNPVVLQPTYNRKLWGGDSSFDVFDGTISQLPIDPKRVIITEEEKRMIFKCLTDFFTGFGYGDGSKGYFKC